MTPTAQHADTFASLHRKGDPLILFNIWDAGSAKAMAEAGARALATGSWSAAAAHGYGDREALPLDLALANLRRIVANVDLPVTFDMEGGYGTTPDAVGQTTAQVMAAGAVGVNFEDQIVGGEGLYSIDEQAARRTAAMRAADAAGVGVGVSVGKSSSK